MADNLIRWKRGDYISLGRAVSNFNKKIRELKTEENNLYLPEEIDYKDIRDNILTRKELNRQIKSLRAFMKDDATELIELAGGEEITKWERNELNKLSRNAQRRLKTELSTINKVEKPYVTQREIELNSQLKNIKNWRNKQGFEFDRIKSRLKNIGTLDYDLRKANTYKQNYLNNMQDAFGNFENYEILRNKLEKIKNSKEFFDYIQQSDYLADLFLYYDDESGTLVYGGLSSNEDIFNSELVKLGLLE